MAKRLRILTVLSPEALDSLSEPALARGRFIARETNAFLELFASEYPLPFYASLLGRSGDKEEASALALHSTLSRLQELAETLSREEHVAVSADASSDRHPYEGIIQKVSSVKPDLVIKTACHESSLNRTFFNYTDWHLIRTCPCPLLLAKGTDNWATRRIVACVDPAHIYGQAEPLDCSIIEIAQLLAYRLRGELQIFHAVEFLPEPIFRLFQPGSDYDAYKEQVREEHEYLLRELLRFYGLGPQRLHIREGRSAETLQAFVHEIEASLVVMGVIPKGALEDLLIGNTAEKVLNTLNCDILVVKSNPIEAKETAETWLPFSRPELPSPPVKGIGRHFYPLKGSTGVPRRSSRETMCLLHIGSLE